MNKKRVQKILDTVPVFDGTLGVLELGIQSIVFPNVLMAARFVDFLNLGGNAWMEDDRDGSAPTRFNERVTIQVDTKS